MIVKFALFSDIVIITADEPPSQPPPFPTHPGPSLDRTTTIVTITVPTTPVFDAGELDGLRKPAAMLDSVRVDPRPTP